MKLIELSNEIEIDIKGSLARFGNMESFYVKYLKKFIEDRSFDSLTEGIEEGNKEKIKDGAHTLKGVTGNLGLTKLYNISIELMNVQALADEEITSLYGELKKELEKTKKVLEKLD